MSYFTHFSVQVFLVTALACPCGAGAQVSINTDGSVALPSAILDVKSTTRGMLTPRMTSAQRGAIASPAAGLLVYDTNTNTFWFFDGTQWKELGSAAAPAPSVITPPLISATVNNYAPTGFADANMVRVSGNNGIQMITGFPADTNGEEKTILNIGAYPLYLAPEHTGSAAANRIAYHEEVMIPPGESCRIVYDGAAGRWRPVNTPAENYHMTGHTVHYDKDAGKFPEGVLEDEHLGYGGSGTRSSAGPTAARPFASWQINNGSNPTGDISVFLLKVTEFMSFAGSAHIVTKTTITTPAALSTGAQRYYVRHILSASPASLLPNVNNSIGIRYRDDVTGSNWQCFTRSAGGSETTLDSGVAVQPSTMYDMAISLNKAGTEATFWINGIVVGRISSNLPQNTGLGAAIELGSLVGTATKDLFIHRLMAAAIAP